MREYNAHQPAGPVDQEPEVAPAPMGLTVGEAILEAAELNSGVPAPRVTDAGGSSASSRSGPLGKAPVRAAEPVCRADHGRPAAGRGGARERAEEVVRSHG